MRRTHNEMNPIATNGFIMNMRTDYKRLDGMRGMDEVKDVKYGEAVVVYDEPAGGRWRDNHTHGMTVHAGPGWRCIGVAASHCNYSKDINADRGFTCAIGGLITVVNESRDTINPGDIIQVAEPGLDFETTQKGIPKEKGVSSSENVRGLETKSTEIWWELR